MNKAYRLIWSRAKDAWVIVAEIMKGSGGPPPITRTLLALATVLAMSSAALALPTGPQVLNGSVSMNTQGNTLTVTNTPNSIINWQKFSIASGETTRFVQQNAASAVLNRVIGVDPSSIMGTLQSNGRIFLINPNGVIFGQGARVDAAGLVASSLNMTDADFLGGRHLFNAGPSAGAVRNEGNITTPNGGQVWLIAPDVENSGIITSPNGTVTLAAGHSVHVVDPHKPEVAVVVSAPADQAVNIGSIVAQGGRIAMYGAIVGQKGTVSANSAVRGENGRIYFKATKDTTLAAGSSTTANGPDGGNITVQSETGDTMVSGTITATGTDGQGGTVQVLGNRVGLIDSAAIDASGTTGGGTILVGGDYQGKNPDIQNAQATYVGKDTSIKADASLNGDGGKVVVWADDVTRSYGSISARGGAAGGNGGFVETSGHNYLDFQGQVDTRAPQGSVGSLLLDPTDITIDNSGSDILAGGSLGGGFFSGAAGNSTLTWSTINTQLGLGGLEIQTNTGGIGGNGDIFINAGTALTNSNYLVLLANRDILFSPSVSVVAAGEVDLIAGWSNSGLAVNGGTGNITFGAASSITTPGNIIMRAGNSISQPADSVITANTLSIGGDVNGGPLLPGGVNLSGTNMVNTLAVDIAPRGGGSGSLSFTNGKNLTIGPGTYANGIDATGNTNPIAITVTGGGLTVDQPIISGGSLTLKADGNFTSNAAIGAAGFLDIETMAGGNILINSNVSSTLAGEPPASSTLQFIANGVGGHTFTSTSIGAISAASGTITINSAGGNVTIDSPITNLDATGAVNISTRGTGTIGGSGVIKANNFGLQTLTNSTGLIGAGVSLSTESLNSGDTATFDIGSGTAAPGGVDISHGFGPANINTVNIAPNAPFLFLNNTDILLAVPSIDTGTSNLAIQSGGRITFPAGVSSFTGQNVVLQANQISFAPNTSIGSAGGTVGILPFNLTPAIVITPTPVFNTNLEISGSVLSTQIDPGATLNLGNKFSLVHTGGISIQDVINRPGSTLSLATAGPITQAAGGTITVQNLATRALADVDLSTATNSVSNIAAQLGNGTTSVNKNFRFKNSGNLGVGAGIDGLNGISTSISGGYNPLAPDGIVALISGGALVQTGGPTALIAGKAAYLEGLGVNFSELNPTGVIAGKAIGTGNDYFNYVSSNGISVSTVNGFSGIQNLATTTANPNGINLQGTFISQDTGASIQSIKGLWLNTTGAVNLSDPSNNVASILTNGGTSGAFSFTNNNSLIIGAGAGSGITTSNQPVNITVSSGNLTINQPINAGTGGNVTLSAPIIIGNTSGTDITGNALVLSATNGITNATVTNPLKTAVASVQATNTGASNPIRISNNGALTVNGISNSGTGTINVAATGDLAISGGISAGSSVSLSTSAGSVTGAGILDAPTVIITATDGILINTSYTTAPSPMALSLSNTGGTGVIAVSDTSDYGLNLKLALQSAAGQPISISHGGTMSGLTVDGNVSTNNGMVSITSSTPQPSAMAFTAFGNITTAGAAIFLENSAANTSINMAAGSLLNSGGGAIAIASDNMTLAGGANSINAGAGPVLLGTASAGTDLNIGTGAIDGAGSLGIDATELANITTTGGLFIGGGSSTGDLTVVGPASLSGATTLVTGGGIFISNPINTGVNNLTLSAGQAITGSGAITASTLLASAATGIGLTGANNVAMVTLTNSTSTTIDYSSNRSGLPLTISTVNSGGDSNITEATGDINLQLVNTGGGNASITAANGAIIDGDGVAINVFASTLNMSAYSGIGVGDAIDTQVNNLGTISGGLSGGVNIENYGAVTTGANPINGGAGPVTIIAHSPLTIGTGGVTASGDIILEAAVSGTGDILTINGPVDSTGGSVALKAGNSIVKNSTVSGKNGVTENGITPPAPSVTSPTVATVMTESTVVEAINIAVIPTEESNPSTSPQTNDEEEKAKKEAQAKKDAAASQDKKGEEGQQFCN